MDELLLQGFFSLMGLIGLAVTAFALFAFVDGALRRPDAYQAAGKQTKAFWLIILGLAVLAGWFGILFLQIAGLVATIVYTVDVRPALRQITGGGGFKRRGGSSSDGPYGPFNRG